MDRHNRGMGSLYKNGLAVTPGIDVVGTIGSAPSPINVGRIMAYDAYNGVPYWDFTAPDAARAGMPRDCGWVAMADDYVYVANRDDCVGLDVETGRPMINMTTPEVAGERLHWGYLAVENNLIFGSGRKSSASLLGHSRDYIFTVYYDNQPFATSKYLFCRDRYSGNLNWTYHRTGGSVIPHPLIAIGDNFIYFIESRSSAAVNDSDGRVTASTLFGGTDEYLVKINKTTGAEVQVNRYDFPFLHAAFLCYLKNVNVKGVVKDVILTTGTKATNQYTYEHHVFDADDLSLEFTTSFTQTARTDDHGEQDQHPCIIGNTIYIRTHKIDMSAANPVAVPYPMDFYKCGTTTASGKHLLLRKWSPMVFELDNPTVGIPTFSPGDIRSGCWINIIPAGGLVLIPESTAGCWCDNPYPPYTDLPVMRLQVTCGFVAAD